MDRVGLLIADRAVEDAQPSSGRWRVAFKKRSSAFFRGNQMCDLLTLKEGKVFWASLGEFEKLCPPAFRVFCSLGPFFEGFP